MRFIRLVILAALSRPLFAGCGLFLDLGSPLAANDPLARGAWLTVRLFNCFGESREGSRAPYPRETAAVAGTAEGIVNGRRISMLLKIVKLRKSGMSAVWWDPPNEGVWMLSFRVTDAGPYYIGGQLQTVLGTLFTLSRGAVDQRTQMLGISPYPQDLDTALRNLPTSQ